jgi:DNA replication protein DnaC
MPTLAVESAESRQAREAKQAKHAEDRHRAELLARFTALVFAAGERYRGCRLDNFNTTHPQQQKVVAALREYLEGDATESVILFGPVGTGKDHLAFALCREAIRSGKTVGWINGQKWFGSIRDAMDTNKTEDSLIADLRRPDVLCVSDPLPPVGPLTQHQSTMFYRLIDARYSRGVPTICTVNVASDQEADERIGVATWDRLCHGAWKLSCAWPSYRKTTREV